ncbi:ArsR/SmtB family transcription factor [Thermosediminibacter oceani]|uniref:Transcriptional regulator, ArsR family n=1 Tax=Thermosediminibacter oceani (strain ATCC BAA-1034 / DSM 16646 / JW/IW-1228P) TaxID=555079 RepID=D9S0E9_THEOJ|nr:metalloregulator ArsR/SmtB family transcription factor [Thermosediminibacter oceani]ADL08807.1 transcriptional regulator, ArsR family [Thermosediminibacter oceani DSM 16646]
MTLNLTESKVRFLESLADKTRLRIVEALKEREKTVSQLVQELGATQSNISGHLRLLKISGIIKSRQEGKYVYYSLSSSAIADFLTKLEDMLAIMRREALEGV